MSGLGREAHERINAALRQTLADCLPGGMGGIAGIWDRDDRWTVAPMPDLAATFEEHRMAGLGVDVALEALAAEVQDDANARLEVGLVGVGIIGRAPTSESGVVGTCVAAVESQGHLISWPVDQAAPVWSIKPLDQVGGGQASTVAAALHRLHEALSRPLREQ